MFIRLRVFRMWLSLDVEVREFFEGCSLGVSVLSGDGFWWVYLHGLCLGVMVYRLYVAPFVSCFVHTLRFARMAFNNICRLKKSVFYEVSS
ncbi:hypothetical protein MtrunA17_Chr8g0379071 [Medicago truncatula]|uniref:Uncharacterized protein n=1 Tax=Medicago truncatula TaxID=3880 RepID=A0A396GQK5_MEDTR|nr:hypothetical protein MtrunA17_Chr8g0379071 [Medicago truncatula]